MFVRRVPVENSLLRHDLSRIHWFKRLTRSSMCVIFGLSLALALSGQFLQLDSRVLSPVGLFTLRVDNIGVTLLMGENFSTDTSVSFQYDSHTGLLGRSRSSIFRNLLDVGPEAVTHTSPVPGLNVRRVSSVNLPLVDHQTLAIHHTWLISISAALYFFTRVCVRRRTLAP
jgi:hypothetical protein